MNLELKWDTRCKNLTFFRVSSGEKLIQHGAVNFAKIPLSTKRYREDPRGFGCLLRTIFEGLKRCLGEYPTMLNIFMNRVILMLFK